MPRNTVATILHNIVIGDRPSALPGKHPDCPPTPCWDHVNRPKRDGYRRIVFEGRQISLHRLVYETLRGPIPTNYEIDHLCRHRGCCNPWHLEPVTGRINILRGASVSAENARKTHCPSGHPYSGSNLRVDDTGRRYCRACARERQRKYRSRKKSRMKEGM